MSEQAKKEQSALILCIKPIKDSYPTDTTPSVEFTEKDECVSMTIVDSYNSLGQAKPRVLIFSKEQFMRLLLALQ